MNSITPVEEHGGIQVKMDHLFSPFGSGGVNGGKLRQCFYLVKGKLTKATKAIYTGCSVHSPQGPIVASVAKHYGVECRLFVGASHSSAMKHEMVRMAVEHYGAKLYQGRSGRHNVLYSDIRKMRESHPGMIVEYGVNLESNIDAMIGSIANQVQNIPDRLEHLVITCGSGVTATGLIYGLNVHGKQVDELHLVGTAPNRLAKIKSRLDVVRAATGLNISTPKIVYHDLFATADFQYERPCQCSLGGIKLHPNYEAKAWSHYLSKSTPPAKTLFWIVGAKPEC